MTAESLVHPTGILGAWHLAPGTLLGLGNVAEGEPDVALPLRGDTTRRQNFRE